MSELTATDFAGRRYIGLLVGLHMPISNEDAKRRGLEALRREFDKEMVLDVDVTVDLEESAG